jgi:hypothetical protein
VAELVADDLDVDARLERQGRSGVPGRVQLDHRQPGLGLQLLERGADLLRPQGLAEL